MSKEKWQEEAPKAYTFYTEDAIRHGVDQAIILANLRFWVSTNRANKRNFLSGHYWTYNSADAFTNLFPFYSRRKISRLLKDLEDSGAILSRVNNPKSYDRTKAYTVLTIPLDKNDQCIYTDKKTQLKNKKSSTSQCDKFAVFNSCVRRDGVYSAEYPLFTMFIEIHNSHWKERHVPHLNRTIKKYDDFLKSIRDSAGLEDCEIEQYMEEYQKTDTISDRHFNVFCHWLYGQVIDDDYRGFDGEGNRLSVEEMTEVMNES